MGRFVFELIEVMLRSLDRREIGRACDEGTILCVSTKRRNNIAITRRRHLTKMKKYSKL